MAKNPYKVSRTLQRMRAASPEHDRDLPEFAPPAARRDANVPRHAIGLPDSCRSTTLEDLRDTCGPYADAAVNEAKAAAAMTWLMRQAVNADLGYPYPIIVRSMLRASGSRRAGEGYPSLSGTPELYSLATLAPDDAAHAVAICADMMTRWQAAGSPHLANAVQAVRSTIIAAIRMDDARAQAVPA